MKPLSYYDLYLFDFDGLLVNTEDLHMQAYQEMLDKRGFGLDWDFKTYAMYAHKSTEALSEAVYSALPDLREKESDWNVLREEKQAIYGRLIQSGKVEMMPGAAEFLGSIGNKPKVVVTNSTREQIDIIRPHLSALSMINRWFTRETYELAKPAPDGYLSALTHYPGSTAVGFEDTEKGILSLQQAGVDPVLVCPSHYPKVPVDCRSYCSLEETYQRR